MSHTVVGIFETAGKAQEAKQYLLANGFDDSEVDISSSDTGMVSDSIGNNTYQDSSIENNRTWEANKKEDTTDSIGRFFKNLFGSDDNDDEVVRYSEAGRRGTILTVHAQSSDQAMSASSILDSFGAVDVDEFSNRYSDTNSSYSSGASYATGSTLSDSSITTSDTVYGSSHSLLDSEENLTADTSYSNSDSLRNTNDISESTGSIPVIREEMEVGKRQVETGGVRLRSRVVERPVEENIRLRVERVTVERNPVNRPATDSDFNTFQEGTVEAREYKEVPVVSKTARVVEEVNLRKDVEETEETVRGTVRNTEVLQEQMNTSDEDLNNPSPRNDF